MNVYECGVCGKFSVERPKRVEVISADSDLTEWSAWFCSDCYSEIGRIGFESGNWSSNGYTWTGADGARIDITGLSTKRFPRPPVDSEG